MFQLVCDVFWFLCGIAWEFLLYTICDKVAQGFLGTTSDSNEKQVIWLLECAMLFCSSAVVYVYHMPYFLFTMAWCTLIYTIFLFDNDIGKYRRGLRTTWQDCHSFYKSLNVRGHINSSVQTQQGNMASNGAPPPSIQKPSIFLAQQPNASRASPVGGGSALPQNQNVPVSSPLAPTAPLLAKNQPSPRTGSPVIPQPSTTGTVAPNMPVVGDSASAKKLDGTGNSGRISDAANYVVSHMPNSLTSIKTWIWQKFGRDASIPPGLFNGSQNLCFINCTLQALSRSPQLRDELQMVLDSSHTQHISIKARTLLKEAVNVFLNLTAIIDATSEGQPLYNKTQSTWLLRKVISEIGDFNLVVDPSQARNRQKQQDAAEFLLWFLDNLHNAQNVPIPGVLSSYSRLGVHNLYVYNLPHSPSNSAQTQLNKLRCTYNFPSTNLMIDHRRRCLTEISKVNGLAHMTYIHLVTRLSDLDWLLYKDTHNSVVDDLFTGQLASALCCERCHHISVTTDTFRILTLPIPSGHEIVSIVSCFEELIRLETLTPQNRPSFDSCKCIVRNDNFKTSTPNGPNTPGSPGMRAMSPINVHSQCIMRPPYSPSTPVLSSTLQLTNTGCVRQTTLQRLPDCLIVQLLRFSFVNQKGIKLQTRVKVVVNQIDLSPLILVRESYPVPMLYSLFGICMHCDSSSVLSGHYCTYSLSSDGHWYLFNDETVSKVDIEQELEKKDVQENMYILYYRKVVSRV